MPPVIFDPEHVSVAEGTSRYPKAPRFVSVFIVLFVLVAIGLTIWFSGVHRYIVKMVGTPVKATVVDTDISRAINSTSSSRSANRRYFVTYRYVFNGTERTSTENVARNTFSVLDVGDPVDIKAVNVYPYSALLRSNVTVFRVIIGTVIGSVCVIGMIVILARALRNTKRFHQHGIVLPGNISMVDSVRKRSDGTGYWVEFNYQFKSPNGQPIQAKARKSLASSPNLSGAAIAIIYADDKTYDVL